MNVILNKYKLGFYNQTYKNPVTGVISANKIMSSTNDVNYMISTFFNDYQKAQDVLDYIIGIIDKVLDNSIAEGETGSQSGIAVYISATQTKFLYFDGVGTYLSPDLIIPTSDFRQIATEWQQFLIN